MKEKLAPEQIEQLRAACGGDEIMINGEVWTMLGGLQEFKVSPRGLDGDWDTDCRWVDLDQVVCS